MAADLVTYGILALVLLFVFFAYLMIRRTVTGFKQGVEEGQNRR
jgi:preprotein translocase subunit YajC